MAIKKHYRSQSARSRLQRAFLAWWAESGKQFKVPFRIAKRTDDLIFFEATSSKLTVTATLYRSVIDIDIRWEDGPENIVLCIDGMPELTNDGYVCREISDPAERGIDTYAQKDRKPHPTREDVWRIHLFDVLLDYVNNSVTRYPWIEIYEIPRVTPARLNSGTTWTNFGVVLRNSKDEPQSAYIKQASERQIVPNPMFIRAEGNGIA